MDNTALGKAIKTLIWVGVSAAVMAVASYVTENKELFTPLWIAGANIALVFGKNLLDPKVKNI